MAIYNKLLLLNIADLILSEVWIDNYKQTKKKMVQVALLWGRIQNFEGCGWDVEPMSFCTKIWHFKTNILWAQSFEPFP